MLGKKDVCVYCIEYKKMYYISKMYLESSYKEYYAVCRDCFGGLSEEFGSKFILESAANMKKVLKEDRKALFESYHPSWMKSSVHFIKTAEAGAN